MAAVMSGRCRCSLCSTHLFSGRRRSWRMLRNNVLAIAVAALVASPIASTVTPQHETIAIVGATFIDVSGYGRSTKDIENSIVLIEDGKIVAAGSAAQIVIPSGATRIDAHGEFLVPGLIDGFGALRTQAFGNSYLYDGVTTVYVPTVLPNGGAEGELKIVGDAPPGPRLFRGAPMTGYSEQGADPSDKPMLDHRLHDRRLSDQQLIARVDRLADHGYRGGTISYDVWAAQGGVIVAENKRRGTATLAEPAFTTYPYAIHAGVSGLLHNDHYLLELAPPAVLLDRADNLGAGSAASRAICTVDPASNEVADFGAQLAKSNTALMPTLSMEATADALDVPNPWSAPSAALIKAADWTTLLTPLPESRRFWPASLGNTESGFGTVPGIKRRSILASISLERNFWPETRQRATELCPAAVSTSNSHCCIGSASLRVRLSRRQPATLPISMAGVTSGASNRGVSPTCLSSTPTHVAILQLWTTSTESSSGGPCSIGNPCSKHVA